MSPSHAFYPRNMVFWGDERSPFDLTILIPIQIYGFRGTDHKYSCSEPSWRDFKGIPLTYLVRVYDAKEPSV
jgi:hypothetical protein